MAISKVVYHTSSSDTTGTTWMDVTPDTVTASTLLSGETATAADGVQVTGTYVPSATPNLQAKTATPTNSAQVITADTEGDLVATCPTVTIATNSTSTSYLSPAVGSIVKAGSTGAIYKIVGELTVTYNGNTTTITFDDYCSYYNIENRIQASKFTVSPANADSRSIPSWIAFLGAGTSSSSSYIRVYFGTSAARTIAVTEAIRVTEIGSFTYICNVHATEDDGYSSPTTWSKDLSSFSNGDEVALVGYVTTSCYLSDIVTWNNGFTFENSSPAISIVGTSSSITITGAAASKIELYISKAELTTSYYDGLSQVAVEGVVAPNLIASNIKSGVTIKVGTATDDDSVASVAGTYEGKYTDDMIRLYMTRDTSYTWGTWPSSLSILGPYAFAGWTVLRIDSLPAGLVQIGQYCFYGCNSLALTSLPSTLTNINQYAFSGCTNLALASLPSGVTSISQYAFNQCSKLALTSLPSGITAITSRAFNGCTKLALTSLPSGVTTIGTYAFSNCEEMPLSSLPANLTLIDNYAFNCCYSLTVSVLPSTLTTINTGAFMCCESIESISSNAAITTLGNAAFNGSSAHPMSIQSASFPNMAISSLGTVFGYTTAEIACQHLAFCDIGSTRSITYNAFYDCYALQTLVLRRSDAICSLSNISAFYNTPMRGYNSLTGTVYVPSALISTYQTATNWSTLYNDGTVTFEAIEGSEYELD